MRRLRIALGLILSAAACARPPAEIAVSPVPPGLDSIATVRWVAGERSACRGVFEAIFDEGMVGRATQPDSARSLRYFARIAAVRCTSAR